MILIGDIYANNYQMSEHTCQVLMIVTDKYRILLRENEPDHSTIGLHVIQVLIVYIKAYTHYVQL